MSVLKCRLFIALVLFSALAQARGQANVAPSSLDPYRNFLGYWHGEGGLVSSGKKDLPSAVTLHIVEEKNGRRMRWEYAWGKPDYSRYTRWVEFDSKTGQVIMKLEHAGEETYTTSGLKDFVQTGFGSFTALGKSGEAVQIQVVLALDETTFAYHWERSIGQTSVIYSRFHFVNDGVTNKAVDANETGTKQ